MPVMKNSSQIDNNKLIVDTCSFKLIKNPEVISEDTPSGGKRKYTRLTGLVQKADAINENERLYPYDVMVEAVEAIQPSINQRMVLGELDHPEDAKIHTENACLLLTKLWMEGKDVYAQFEILEGMPKGKMLKALIDQGVTVSISSRGVGDMETSLMEDGTEINKVCPGFRFCYFDAVNEPSVRGTSLSVMESKIRKNNLANKIKLEKSLINEFKKVLS